MGLRTEELTVAFKPKDHWVMKLIIDQVDTKRKLGIPTDVSFEIIRLLRESITLDSSSGVVYKKDTRFDDILNDITIQDPEDLDVLIDALKAHNQTWIAGSILAKLRTIATKPAPLPRVRQDDN